MKLSTVFTVACMAAVSTTTDAAPTPASYNLARRASETSETINTSASLASAASLASENSQNQAAAALAPIAASSKIVVDAGSSVVPTTNKESTQKSVSPEEQQAMREGTSKSRVATSESSNASAPQEPSTSSSSSARAATLMKEIIAAVRTRETALAATQDPTDVRSWLTTLVQMNPELTARMVQNVAAMEVKLLKAQGKETSVEFRAFQAVAQSTQSSEKETGTPRKESSTMPEGTNRVVNGKSASAGAGGLEMGKPLSAGVTEKMPEMPKDGDAVMPAGMASMVGMQGSGAFSFSALAGLSSVLSMFLIL
ncbi:hypothetical protein BJ741DRAFT_595263 [Chytriomyces cf. hyalinus JEL632]|nr:hypothetical protein BJ741DRAFT_595263 [Chytriomyces cf. hyalinus JEL632]